MGSNHAKRMRSIGYNLISLAIFIILWFLVARWQSSPFFASPAEIAQGFAQMVTVGDEEGITIFMHLWKSIIRVFSGFGAACVLGIPGGLVLGLFPFIYNRSRIIIEPVRFISPIAWIPVAIVLLIGFTRYVFVIWVASFFPIFITTLWSVRNVNPTHINVARVAGASRWFVITRIVVPSILPHIVGGMRVSLGISWMCIVAAEMIGGEWVGIGRLILKSSMVHRMDIVVVGMLTIGVLGYCLNEVIIKVEKRIFRWRAAVSID
ncbi:MAG: ABC transporter permease [Thermodesulfobacteriota bacterium]